jgi:hypothetical protein
MIVDIVEMLINRDTDVDMTLTAGSSRFITAGHTYDIGCLQYAAGDGHVAVLRVLLAIGAKIWDEWQGLPDVAGGLSRAAVIEMKRNIEAPT